MIGWMDEWQWMDRELNGSWWIYEWKLGIVVDDYHYSDWDESREKYAMQEEQYTQVCIYLKSVNLKHTLIEGRFELNESFILWAN